jgi:hypothetical protein
METGWFFLAAPVGAFLGAGAGTALALAIVSAMDMSSREGKSGYFAGALGGLGGLGGFVAAGLASLSWVGVSIGWSLLFVLLYALALVGIALSGLAISAWARGGLGANQAKPELLIELRGALPENLRISVQEGSESARVVEGIERPAPNFARGATELYERTNWRSLILTSPDGNCTFEIDAGARPRHSDSFGPWRKASRAISIETTGRDSELELRWRIRDPNVEFERERMAAASRD